MKDLMKGTDLLNFLLLVLSAVVPSNARFLSLILKNTVSWEKKETVELSAAAAVVVVVNTKGGRDT